MNKKTGQGQYQNNPFFKISVAQAHVAAFYGYREGRRSMGDESSDASIAKNFVLKYDLDIEPLSLSQRADAYKLNMIDIKNCLTN